MVATMTTATLPERIDYDVLYDLVIHEFGADSEAKFQIDDFISAGYGILVYSNHDLGHPMLGERIFLKVGPTCTITEIPSRGSTIPVQPPDGRMAWRYILDSYYPGGSFE